VLQSVKLRHAQCVQEPCVPLALSALEIVLGGVVCGDRRGLQSLETAGRTEEPPTHALSVT